MQGYRDDGVVLRTQKLGEADRIITLLTRHNGRVRAVARGVRRTKSRWGARLEPFTHVDVMVHNGRSLDVITQAEVIRAYGARLVSDYPKYTAGVAMLETAERFTAVEKEPAIRQFLLLVGGLRALGDAVEPGAVNPDVTGDADVTATPDITVTPDIGADQDVAATPGITPAPGGTLVQDVTLTSGITPASGVTVSQDVTVTPGNTPISDVAAASDVMVAPAVTAAPADSVVRRDPRMVLDAYFLRSLTFAGYAPALESCARCGTPGKPVVAFAVQAGGMVCAGCRPPGSASPAPETAALMTALLQGDWDQAMRSERRHRVECSGLVAAYLQWHLEHSIRSLRHVERA